MLKEEHPQQRESNLLHWAAKQQIIYLHRRDPDEWTPQRISEEFPISAMGAKRLLKSKFLIEKDKIAQHDAEVDLRWKLLRKIKNSGKCPEESSVVLHKKTIELYLEDKLQHESFKSGSPEFPRPANNAGIKIPIKIGQDGEHFGMLEEYKLLLDSGQTQVNESETSKEQIIVQHPSDKPLSRSEKMAKFLSRRYLREDCGNDPEAATRLDLPENFKMTFVQEFSGRNSISLDQFKKISDHEELTQLESKHVEKKPRKKDLSKADRNLPRIKKFSRSPRAAIAEEQFNDGTYRIGNTVYDNDGEALYRIR